MKTRWMLIDAHGDAQPAAPGDILRPAWPGGRAWYRVHEVVPVDSKVNPHRWRLRVERVPPCTWPELGGRCVGLVPHGYEGPEVTAAEREEYAT